MDLSRNMTISSRHRFMCQDIMEMRSKGWRERRKQEGPKKIDDLHKDAAREARQKEQGGPPPRRDAPGGRGGGRDDRGGPGRGGREQALDRRRISSSSSPSSIFRASA